MMRGSGPHHGYQQLLLGSALELPDGQVPGAVRFLQYEVREGREAGEAVVIPKAFIANCNGPFILQLNLFEEG